MEIRARFIGKNGSLGYEYGRVYRITIEHNMVTAPWPCPYASIEAFLRNWLPLKPGD